MRRKLYDHLTKTNYNGINDKIKAETKKTKPRKVSRTKN